MSIFNDGPLFRTKSVQRERDHSWARIRLDVEDYPAETFVEAELDELLDRCLRPWVIRGAALAGEPTARPEFRYNPDVERRVPVREVRFPFTGDEEAFYFVANGVSLDTNLAGTVERSHLLITYRGYEIETDAFADCVKRHRAQITEALAVVQADIDRANADLRDWTTALIGERQAHVLAEYAELELLGLLTGSSAAPSLPVVAEVCAPGGERPALPDGDALPHCHRALAAEHHRYIVRRLYETGQFIERGPSGMRNHREEVLRHMMLLPLALDYRGRATAEAYNRRGKTDIRIAHVDDSLFIAECKVWDGPEDMRQAVKQLLSYLSWHEQKAALILFVKSPGFKHALEAITMVMQDLGVGVPGEGEADEQGCRTYEVADTERPGFVVEITVLAFHVHVGAEEIRNTK